MFDVARARGLYVSLGEGWIYLNAHECSQIPERVNTAAATSFRTAPLCREIEATTGSHSRQQHRGTTIGEGHVQAARRAIGDLVGTRADNVVLGPSRAMLLRALSESLSHRVGIGTEIVLTRNSDTANVAPWLRAGHLYGASIKWAEADLSTGVLPAWQFSSLVTPATSLVCIPAAHRLVGTVTDVEAVASTVHRAAPSAWTIVDATDVLPYQHVDIAEWNADVVALDLAPMGGPQLGALAFRDAEMFKRLRGSYAASPASVGTPAALEWEKPQASLCGAVPALADHWAGLDDAAVGTRRRRLETTMPKVQVYLSHLGEHLVQGLQDLGRVHVVGVDSEGYGQASSYLERVPRVSFIVPGVDAPIVQERLAANGVIVGVCRAGQDSLFDAMGVGESGGAVTVGLAPYNTAGDIDHLLRAVASLS